MLNVFITVDTEFWPRFLIQRGLKLSDDIDRDIYGVTSDGDYGVPFQLKMLNAFHLKAVFFVESLCACVVGVDVLRQIVQLIQEAGQEVQMHIHTEWLAKMDQSILPNRTGKDIKNFSEDEQSLIISKGIQNLRDSGASHLCAFRAGNYGANLDTLRALERNGILFDTSYNPYYLDISWMMEANPFLLQPKKLFGVYEFPVSFFRDWPKHYRHAQICACSSQELENALFSAWEEKWYSFVIVLHSSELIKRMKQPLLPNRIVTERFQRLCRFLSDNRDKFCTRFFSEINPVEIPSLNSLRPLNSKVTNMVWRYGEQLLSRFM